MGRFGPASGKYGPKTSEFVEAATDVGERLAHRPTMEAIPLRPPAMASLGELIAGRYRVLKVIGQGVMSRVYLAEQVGIDRHVALKVIHCAGMPRDELLARFLREARVLARATNPNVIAIYDICTTEADEPCIATEYVDGISLADALKATGRFSPAMSIRILMQVARAVETAHSLGIVHRDLKPSNVLFVKAGRGCERVKVADFGLATNLGPRSVEDREVVIAGTPSYMAPEQVTGAGVDARADIYAMGCMLYEVLSGVRAFPDGGTNALFQQLYEEPAPLLDVPSPLLRVIKRALEKNPNARFATAEEFSAALLEAAAVAGITRRELCLLELMMDDAIVLPADEVRKLESLYYSD